MKLHRHIDDRVTDGYSYLVDRDYEMAGTMFSDVADLQHVSELIQQGEYAQAKIRVSGLDTAVRDEIPRELYDALYRD